MEKLTLVDASASDEFKRSNTAVVQAGHIQQEKLPNLVIATYMSFVEVELKSKKDVKHNRER